MLDSGITTIAGWVAGALTLSAYVPYFLSTIRGKTQPHKATWWILLVVGLMLAGSYYSIGAKNSIWVPIGYVVGPFIIAMLSIRFGESGFSKFDFLCLTGTIIAGVLWWLLNTPFTALMINLVMDWLGLMPTVRKAFHRPHTEDRLAWAGWLMGSIINIFAVENWTFPLSVYPIYMVIGNSIIAILVCWPRHKKIS